MVSKFLYHHRFFFFEIQIITKHFTLTDAKNFHQLSQPFIKRKIGLQLQVQSGLNVRSIYFSNQNGKKNKIKKDRNRISSFCDWPLDQAQYQKAVEFSTTSLDNLQKFYLQWTWQESLQNSLHMLLQYLSNQSVNVKEIRRMNCCHIW